MSGYHRSLTLRYDYAQACLDWVLWYTYCMSSFPSLQALPDEVLRFKLFEEVQADMALQASLRAQAQLAESTYVALLASKCGYHL